MMNSRPLRLYWNVALFLGIWNTTAQIYEMERYTMDAGGGTSRGGSYQVSGSIGQADASLQPMTGGAYELVGGFWAGWVLHLDDGLPPLSIQNSPAGIIISWPAETPAAVLEETQDLTGGNWQPSSVVNGSPVPPTDKTMFFRLVR